MPGRSYTPSSIPTSVRIVVDVLIYLTGCGGVVALKLLVDPITHGFYCHDPNITYPHRPDTITYLHLLFAGVVTPVALVVVLELVFRVILGLRRSFKNCLLAASKLTALYLYGLLVCHLVTEVLKVCVGGLRPHFMDTCRPNFTALNCSQGYITEYTCMSGAQVLDIRDSKKSFPSTIAAQAFYVATYLVFYLEERVDIPFSSLLKSFFQMALITLATYCACTRVHDNQHHLVDVVGGAALGVGIGLWVIFWVSKHLRRETLFSSVYKYTPADLEDTIFLRDQNTNVPNGAHSPRTLSVSRSSATSSRSPMMSQDPRPPMTS